MLTVGPYAMSSMHGSASSSSTVVKSEAASGAHEIRRMVAHTSVSAF